MLAFTFPPSGPTQGTGAPFAGVRNGGWLSTVTLISFGEELMAKCRYAGFSFLRRSRAISRVTKFSFPTASSILSFILSLSVWSRVYVPSRLDFCAAASVLESRKTALHIRTRQTVDAKLVISYFSPETGLSPSGLLLLLGTARVRPQRYIRIVFG